MVTSPLYKATDSLDITCELPELKSNNGRPLRFDFAVFDDDGNIDFLIEYQGSQHYVASSKFGGKKGLYQ